MDTKSQLRDLYFAAQAGDRAAAADLCDALEAIRIHAARSRLIDFTRYTFPGYVTAWHHEVIASALDRVALGQLEHGHPDAIYRLMIFVPPRHGKSELASRRFPAYMLGLAPDKQLVAASYAADLARSMNRDSQRVIDGEHYAALFPATTLSGMNVRTDAHGSYLRNADEFEVVGRKGGFKSVGVGGGLVGHGFDVGIIDDPVKDRKQAESKVYRESLFDWYTSVFNTRREGRYAAIVLIMTRWHEDDLAGRLLQQQKDGTGDIWEVVWLPARREDRNENPFRVPLLAVDPREEGEALWPYLFDEEDLKQTELKSPRDWASLHQGRPAPAEGSLFLKTWLQDAYLIEGPAVRLGDSTYPLRHAVIFTVTDLATSLKEKADFTSVGAFALVGPGHLVLLEVDSRRMGGPEHIPAIEAMQSKWGAKVDWIESTAFQLSLVQNARARGLPVRELKADGDKYARAVGATPFMEEQKFWVLQGAWRDGFDREVLGFPEATHDDQVDMLVYGIHVVEHHLKRRGGLPTLPPPDRGRRYDSSVTSTT